MTSINPIPESDDKEATPHAQCLRRRTMLGRCLGASMCLATSTAVGVAAEETGPRKYVPLKTPVTIPVPSLAEPWEPVEFKARFTKRNGANSIVPAMAVRAGEAGIQVFCLFCPHELCIIGIADSEKRPGQKDLLCSCHLSTFDPLQHGTWLDGPAPRGTYQFQFEIKDDAVVVTGIEEDMEKRLL